MRKLLFAVILTVVGISATEARNISRRCDTLNIVSSHVPSPAPVTVVVPEKYLSPGDTCRYDVVYLLHGYGDDYTGYAKGMPLDSLADLHQVIFVCPDGLTSWYWDSPVDTTMQMESYIIHDLLPVVDSRLRTRACR
ncbi:MAG: esterase family protein, partial [Muribaculum sp.]|nr:esterase family protein [Muribaculum sp.]